MRQVMHIGITCHLFLKKKDASFEQPFFFNQQA
jgi:hypothetical protein